MAEVEAARRGKIEAPPEPAQDWTEQQKQDAQGWVDHGIQSDGWRLQSRPLTQEEIETRERTIAARIAKPEDVPGGEWKPDSEGDGWSFWREASPKPGELKRQTYVGHLNNRGEWHSIDGSMPGQGGGSVSPALNIENNFQEKEQEDESGNNLVNRENRNHGQRDLQDIGRDRNVQEQGGLNEICKIPDPKASPVFRPAGDGAVDAVFAKSGGGLGVGAEPGGREEIGGEPPTAISGETPQATNGQTPVAISGDDPASNVVAMFPGINGGLFGIARNAPTWRPPKRKTKPGNPKVAADGYEWRNAPTGDGFVLWRRPYLATGKRGKSEYYAWFAPDTIKQLEKIYGAKRKSGNTARPRGVDRRRDSDSSARWPKASNG